MYEILKRQFGKIGRVRLLMKPPRSCLSWHRDPEPRILIPIITNVGCKMVIEDEAFHMPANGSAYVTNNTKYHNFFILHEVDDRGIVGLWKFVLTMLNYIARVTTSNYGAA